MVTAVLVSLSVEAVFNVPVILIVVGATVRENSKNCSPAKRNQFGNKGQVTICVLNFCVTMQQI